MRRRAKLTLLLTIWWTAVAAVYAEMLLPMARVARPDLAVGSALLASWLGWLLWVPVSLIFIAAVERRPIEAGRLGPPLATAGACVLLAIVAKAIFVWVANDVVPLWYQVKPPFAEVLRDSVRNNLILAILVIGTAHAVHYARAHAEDRVRIAALESGLARARLDALAAQINPHFLFNTLNVIAETLHSDPQAADGMIVSLSSLLRESLGRSGEHLIPLSQEIALLDHYLTLQRLRLGSRLATDIRVADPCRDALVPRLLLQPLAENAIVHGIGRRLEGGRISLEIAIDETRLVVRLANDGPLADPTPDRGGIGLSNIRQRLETLFGDQAELRIATVDQDRTEVTVRQPLILARPA